MSGNLQLAVLPRWVDLLTHTLGAGSHVRKSRHGYRNYFCATVESKEANSFDEMVAAGLAEKGQVINGGKQVYYRATVDGCNAIGLSKAAIKRAFAD
jgi:hypothetical protein